MDSRQIIQQGLKCEGLAQPNRQFRNPATWRLRHFRAGLMNRFSCPLLGEGASLFDKKLAAARAKGMDSADRVEAWHIRPEKPSMTSKKAPPPSTDWHT
jgi:hypothetical protein